MCPAFGCGARRWPLAIMLSADQVPVKSPRSKRPGASGLSWSVADWHGCVTGLCSLQLRRADLSACSRFLCRRRSSIRLAPRHHRPGDPRHLVGQRDCRNLGRAPLHQLHQPWMARVAELLGASDHGERADDEQLSKVSVPCLADAAQLLLTAGGVLLGTSPIQALRSRPERKTFGSGMLATKAVEMSGPTPGIASRARLRLLARCQARTRRSISRI